MSNILNLSSSILNKYYKEIFCEHQATPKGVGWLDQQSADMRYSKMLNIIDNDLHKSDHPTLLDVGCGYGGLWNFLKTTPLSVKYTGIDILEDTIAYCKSHHKNASFVSKNIFDYEPENQFDYVVCNGILTMKRELSLSEMNEFAHLLIKKMFDLCRCGIAFNIHSSYVNFFDNQHFYKSPVEMLGYCLENYSTKVKIDHSYPLYEYTTYVYKP